MNDEFAQTASDFTTLDELTARIRQTLERRNKEAYEAEFSEQIITELIGSSTITYPPQMLDNEIDQLISDLERRLSNEHLDLAAYLKSRQMEMPALREELTPPAITRLKRSLVIFEVAQAENLHAEQDEVQAQSIQTLNEIGRSLKPEQSRKLVTGDFIRNLVSNVTADILIHRTLERLIAIARGNYPPIQADDPVVEGQDEATEPDVQSPVESQPVESSNNSDEATVAENTSNDLEG
jgi:trigger factor